MTRRAWIAASAVLFSTRSRSDAATRLIPLDVGRVFLVGAPEHVHVGAAGGVVLAQLGAGVLQATVIA